MSLTRSAVRFVALAGAVGCSSPAASGNPSPDAGGSLDAALGDDDAGQGAEGGLDGAGPDAAGFVEAPHAAFPQIPANGGPVLAAPKLVTITFAGYSQDAAMKSFGDWIVGSSWLSTTGKEYGVGPGTHAAHVVLNMAAPTQPSDLDTQALLEQKLQDGTLPSADVDAGADGGAGAGEYLYMLFYPPGTTAGSFLAGPSTCLDEGGGHFLGGYHWETQSGPYHVAYAVIPTCSNGQTVEGASDLEISGSHELIEGATDPFPYTNTGYGLTDPADPWSFTGGEVADPCEEKTTTESGFAVQRVWSNAAAKAGGPPCIPVPPGEVLYDVSPSPNKTQLVAAGASVTFTLTGFSTAAVPPWNLQAWVGQSTFQPKLDLSSMKIDNGGTATLKVTVPAHTASMGFADIFVTSWRSATDFNDWPLTVSVP
jgi:hypothetical protein